MNDKNLPYSELLEAFRSDSIFYKLKNFYHSIIHIIIYPTAKGDHAYHIIFFISTLSAFPFFPTQVFLDKITSSIHNL